MHGWLPSRAHLQYYTSTSNWNSTEKKERLCQFIELVGQVVAVENRLVRCPANNTVIFVHIHLYIEKNALSVVLIDKWNPVFPWTCCFHLYSSRSLREPEISASVLGNLNRIILKNLASYCCLKLLDGNTFWTLYVIYILSPDRKLSSSFWLYRDVK